MSRSLKSSNTQIIEKLFFKMLPVQSLIFAVSSVNVIVDGAIAGQYEYSYVSVDDKDRSYPSRMDRFPIPSSELNNNAKVEQYAEWK